MLDYIGNAELSSPSFPIKTPHSKEWGVFICDKWGTGEAISKNKPQ